MSLLLLLAALTTYHSPLDAPATFFTCRLSPQQIRLTRFERQPDGRFRETDQILLSEEASSRQEEETIEAAEFSPDNRWLALGTWLRYDGAILRIVDMASRKLVYRMVEKHTTTDPWFGWKDKDHLHFKRQSHQKNKMGRLYDIFMIAGPDWKSSPRLITKTPVEHIPFQERHIRRTASTIAAAASRLDQLGYLPPARPAPGGTPTFMWLSYFKTPSQAAVSSDGKWIAVFASKVTPHTDMFSHIEHEDELDVLIKSRGWKEEPLPSTGDIFFLQFWRDWLVVGEGKLVPVEPFSLGRGYKMIAHRIRLFWLKNMSCSLEANGAFFIPFNEIRTGDRWETSPWR